MDTTRFLSLALGIIITVLTSGCGNQSPRLVENPTIETLGTPVRSVNWVRLFVTADGAGKARILSSMGQLANNFFVLDIDPESGEYTQHTATVPESNYPTAACLSDTGMLYIGAAYAGRLYRYDPVAGTLADLGDINPDKASFPCAIDEDDNGILWIGSYGTADLTSYDPASGEYTRYGRMDDTDMYCYPTVNRDGTICCRIMMTRPHCVVFDPKTGKKAVTGPVTDKETGSFAMHTGPDGWIYITSSEGIYRLEGFTAHPVDSVPEAPSVEPGHGILSCRFSDAQAFLYHMLEVNRTDGGSRTFDIDYEAEGTEIFILHTGPDNNIYGSSMLPEHLFRYITETGELTDMGRCSLSGGEAYSMTNLNGKIYIASYPGARISVYDPTLPYAYGKTENSNPRELDRIDDVSYRPRSALAGPLGRVWFASIPDYGIWGGPLSWYDPATEERGSYKDIAGEGSCYTLAYPADTNLIAIGTTIQGGTGTQPKVDEAQLILWDYTTEKIVWDGTPEEGIPVINALTALPNGHLCGTFRRPEGRDGALFTFDTATRSFTGIIDLPDGTPLDHGLQQGPDGYLYGLSSSALYRWKPGLETIEVILESEGSFHVAGPLAGGYLYTATTAELKRIRLFR